MGFWTGEENGESSEEAVWISEAMGGHGVGENLDRPGNSYKEPSERRARREGTPGTPRSCDLPHV